MITFIWLAALVIIAIGALVAYSSNKKGKASRTEQRLQQSGPGVGRARGSGDD